MAKHLLIQPFFPLNFFWHNDCESSTAMYNGDFEKLCNFNILRVRYGEKVQESGKQDNVPGYN